MIAAEGFDEPEHCLEVELPFLQVLLGPFSILPLLVGDATPAEVAEVLEVPLAALLDPSIRKVEHWSDPQFDAPRRVPFFAIESQVVWGATAMILSELVTLLEEERGG